MLATAIVAGVMKSATLPMRAMSAQSKIITAETLGGARLLPTLSQPGRKW